MFTPKKNQLSLIFKFYLFTHFFYFKLLYKKRDSRIPLGEKSKKGRCADLIRLESKKLFSRLLFEPLVCCTGFLRYGSFWILCLNSKSMWDFLLYRSSGPPLFHRRLFFPRVHCNAFLRLVRFVSYD